MTPCFYSNVGMDPESSLKLLAEGANVILLDSPEGLRIGIDLKLWISGKRFKGVKMIPPGIHHIYWRSYD